MINEDDDWSKDGVNISSLDILAKVQTILEQGPVILEHWFYRGSRAPSRLIFDEYEDFLNYLTSEARPGDQFLAWDYAALCKDDNTVVSAKYPDASGRTRRRGPY